MKLDTFKANYLQSLVQLLFIIATNNRRYGKTVPWQEDNVRDIVKKKYYLHSLEIH